MSVPANFYKPFAIKMFKDMVAEAENFRESGSYNRLERSYGVCSNIERFHDAASGLTRGKWEEIMANVKNSVLPLTPSYTGSFHYPVPGVDGMDAERAFDRADNKWSGEYGANRIKQCKEAIAIMETQWNDEWAVKKTRANRAGIYENSTVVRFKDYPHMLWRMDCDDGSHNPHFKSLCESRGGYMDLDRISEIVDVDKMKTLTVKQYLKKAEKIIAKRAKIIAKLDALQAIRDSLDVELKSADSMLALVHKVKRI
ncbi:hypothetical protein D3C80_937870 [compost metagenome]